MTADTPFVPPHRRLALDGLDHLERYIRLLFGLPISESISAWRKPLTFHARADKPVLPSRERPSLPPNAVAQVAGLLVAGWKPCLAHRKLWNQMARLN